MLRLMGNSGMSSTVQDWVSLWRKRARKPPQLLHTLSPLSIDLFLQDVQVSKGGIPLLTLRPGDMNPAFRVLRTESGGKGQCGGRALPTCISLIRVFSGTVTFLKVHRYLFVVSSHYGLIGCFFCRALR